METQEKLLIPDPSKIQTPEHNSVKTQEKLLMLQKYNELKRTIPKTSVILYDPGHEIREKYHISNILEGTVRSQIAQFHHCILRELNLKRVVKSYYISDAQLTSTGLTFHSHPLQDFDLIINEIRALCELSHPNIMRLYDVYFDEKYIHLVLELCKGGELFDLLSNDKLFIPDALGIFIQLLEAVKCIHEKGFAHRGLCIENVMFVGNDRKRVKVIGFSGAAKYFDGFRNRYGSPMYMAPEVFGGSYNEMCDVWSCGVIFYTMVVGHQPFQSNNFNELRKKVEKNDMIKNDGWKKLEKDVKGFIKKIFVSVKKRPTVNKLMSHSLITRYLSQNNKDVIRRLMKSVKSLRSDLNFSQKVKLGNKLKIATYKILSPLNVLHDLHVLENLWSELDTNGLDVIMESDLVRNIETLMSKSELSEKAFNMLKKFDLDGKGCVSKDEFIGLLVEISDKGLIRQAFNTLDSDVDGFVDSSDFDAYFKCADYENLKKMMGQCVDKSRLDYDTFFLFVTKFVVSFS